MEKKQAMQTVITLINNVKGNARTKKDLDKGYALKPNMRESNNGSTYFNVQVVDLEGNRVGKEINVGNYNPARARSLFAIYENIIIAKIHQIINEDIVRKMDNEDDSIDTEGFFEVFKAAPKTVAANAVDVQENIEF